MRRPSETQEKNSKSERKGKGHEACSRDRENARVVGGLRIVELGVVARGRERSKGRR